MMDSHTLSNWIQGITGIALLIGLGLVVWELKQSREATTSQLTSEGFAFLNSTNLTVLGERTAEVLARACDEPSGLTRADYYILENYYSAILQNHRRLIYLQKRGSFVDATQAGQSMGIGYLFDSAPGRAYLRRAAEYDPELGEMIRHRLKNWSGEDCREYFGKWSNLVSSELER